MKAVIHSKYGSPSNLKIKEITKPVPKKDEVLINLMASSVTPFDIAVCKGKFPFISWLPLRMMYGLVRPRDLILGYEFAGIIEEVGDDVTSFRRGDSVFGTTYQKMSCYAQYISLRESSTMTHMPKNLSFTEAAVVPDGASTALYFLNKAGIDNEFDILIYGASGSVGTYAVQLAKLFDTKITAVCSTSNFALVQQLGADVVIDYTKSNYGENIESYDIVFDAVGRSSFSQAKPSLKENGKYVTTRFSLSTMIWGKWISITSEKELLTGISQTNSEKLDEIRTLIENEKIVPIIDRRYRLEEIVHAFEYVSKGHKVGNVVINIGE